MQLSQDVRQKIRLFQRIEITEHHIYKRLAEKIQSPENAKIVAQIAEDELRHYEGLKKYSGEELPPYWATMWTYYFISLLFGFTFGIKLMERSEKGVQKDYDDIVYVGGDTQAIFNLEYRIPLVGRTVSLVPFVDAGNTWVLKKSELERKIVTPGRIQILPAQFLPGTNTGLRVSTGVELQVVLPVLNAPFRIDFALNPLRIDRDFVGPVTGIPFGIHEPSHAFKFTVGRTF